MGKLRVDMFTNLSYRKHGGRNRNDIWKFDYDEDYLKANQRVADILRYCAMDLWEVNKYRVFHIRRDPKIYHKHLEKGISYVAIKLNSLNYNVSAFGMSYKYIFSSGHLAGILEIAGGDYSDESLYASIIEALEEIEEGDFEDVVSIIKYLNQSEIKVLKEVVIPKFLKCAIKYLKEEVMNA